MSEEDEKLKAQAAGIFENYPQNDSGTMPVADEVDLMRLASLIRENTAARGVDVWAVEELGLSASSWAKLTGRERSTVSRNLKRARNNDE